MRCPPDFSAPPRSPLDTGEPGAAAPPAPAMRASIVGSKGGAGVAERIVSELPAHRLYLEPFAGLAAVGRLKRPSTLDVFIEKDERTVRTLARLLRPVRIIEGALDPLAAVVEGRSPVLVRGDCLTLDPAKVPAEAVVYCDPPYLGSTRRRDQRYYRHELRGELEHEAFLAWALALPARVLVSGYNSALYSARLGAWRRIDFGAGTRGGRAVESLWCNFAPPLELHDTRFVGAGFRERERIRRKVKRWVRKFQALPLPERAAIREALELLPPR